MRPLSRASKPDPAPSRWAWRMQRLMLTPLFRLTLRVLLPFAITAGSLSWWLSVPTNQQMVQDQIAHVRNSIEQRPEFMVNLMAIDGADSALGEAIRVAVPLDFPLSSFDVDLEAIRAQVMALPPVKDASVRVRPGGVLQIDVTSRIPVAIWRHAAGLTLIDVDGVQIASIAARVDRPDLPILAGDGAPGVIAEALALIDAAGPLGDRLRGLVRMGERRWDVVLDREQRILLPPEEPVRALERVLALDGVDEVLSRDVARVDMRLGDRPTVRMNPSATDAWWQIRQLNSGVEVVR